VEYRQTGHEDIKIDGKSYKIPTWQVHQKLSPDQMNLLNLQERAQTNMGETAVAQSARMQEHLRGVIDRNRLPTAVRRATPAPNLQQMQGNTNPDLRGDINRQAMTMGIGNDDYEESRKRVEDALFARLNPQLERDYDRLENRLANQGVRGNDQAWYGEMDAFNRQSNDARLAVIMQGGQEQSRLQQMDLNRAQFENAAQGQDFTQQIQQNDHYNSAEMQELMNRYRGTDHFNQTATQQYNLDQQEAAFQQYLRNNAFQEEAAWRNQPISEISALLNGSQPTMPQFQPWQGGTVANTPVGQYHYQSAAIDAQNYQSQLAYQQAGMGGMFGLGSSLISGMFGMSDRRMKTKIERVGELQNGLPVYEFNYIMGGPRHIGLMADEVEQVHPDAVVELGGVKMVNYELAVQPRA
jgi:hypothetical protein